MTNSLAKEIFDIVMPALVAHGFTDTGAFLVGDRPKEEEYSFYNDDYRYQSTDTQMADLEQLSNQGEPIGALRNLLRASIEYFELASLIPAKFNEQLRALSGEIPLPEVILLETINERQVNIVPVLNNNTVHQLLDLLNALYNNVDEEDAVILKITDQL